MAGGGRWLDSDLVSSVAPIVTVGLLIGGAVGLVYQAGVDVSEQNLKHYKKGKREAERKERREQKEKKKEERRKERLEWWKTVCSKNEQQ